MSNVEKTAKEALHCKQIVQNLILRQHSDALSSSEEKLPSQHPVISRVYYFRSLLLHKMVDEALSVLDSFPYLKSQLLILGAGKDDSYVSRHSSLRNVYSVDLPAVITETCRSSSGSNVFISSDLRDTSMVNESLKSAGFVFEHPTVVVIECVLCYLTKPHVEQLLRYLSESLSNSLMILYDPLVSIDDVIRGQNGFLSMMESKFRLRGAPILFTMQDATRYRVFLRSCGWRHTISQPISKYIHSFSTKEDMEACQLLGPFDEYASLAMLHNCYHITIASSRSPIFSRLHSCIAQKYVLVNKVFCEDYLFLNIGYYDKTIWH